MKQTITGFEIRTENEDWKVSVAHDEDEIVIASQEGNESWEYHTIPAEFCDSLIEMLQKRKELMP